MNQPKIRIKETSEITCKNCKNNTFVPCFIMREIDRLTVGSSKKTLVPIEVMQCPKCFTILEDTLPEELQKKSNSNVLIK